MPEPVPAPREEGTTTSTGSPLYWAKYGREGAPRLLVLHGGPGADHCYLLPQMLHLGDRHDVLFYDQRGGGRSKSDARVPITWRTQVEDLAAVVEEFSLDPLTIVGYSWGAMLALLYAIEGTGNSALQMPERLALVSPAPLTKEYRRQFEAEFARRQQTPEMQKQKDELAASGLREKDPEAHRQRAFELGVAGYFYDPRNARHLTPFRVVGRVQQSVWESLGDFDVTRQLQGVRIPSLVVAGRDDPIPAASTLDAARALGTKPVLLDECGHVPYVEQPEQLFAALDTFLDAPNTAGR